METSWRLSRAMIFSSNHDMTTNPIAGTLVFLLGGIAAATYLLPFRGVRGWAYETGWLVSVLAGWLVFPLVFDLFVVPGFCGVLGAAPLSALLRSFGFGVLWGVGALVWRLCCQSSPAQLPAFGFRWGDWRHAVRVAEGGRAVDGRVPLHLVCRVDVERRVLLGDSRRLPRRVEGNVVEDANPALSRYRYPCIWICGNGGWR